MWAHLFLQHLAGATPHTRPQLDLLLNKHNQTRLHTQGAEGWWRLVMITSAFTCTTMRAAHVLYERPPTTAAAAAATHDAVVRKVALWSCGVTDSLLFITQNLPSHNLQPFLASSLRSLLWVWCQFPNISSAVVEGPDDMELRRTRDLLRVVAAVMQLEGEGEQEGQSASAASQQGRQPQQQRVCDKRQQSKGQEQQQEQDFEQEQQQQQEANGHDSGQEGQQQQGQGHEKRVQAGPQPAGNPVSSWSPGPAMAAALDCLVAMALDPEGVAMCT